MMSESTKLKFFQNEKKFVVGKSYETLRVDTPPWGTYVSNLETCDEIGNIIPDSEKFLGKYVRSQNYGYGDNRGRYDYFINEKEKTITNSLDYDGKTRYRQVQTYMDKRIDYLMLLEGVGDKINVSQVNEHINKYLFDLNVAKENCTFMNPTV